MARPDRQRLNLSGGWDSTNRPTGWDLGDLEMIILFFTPY
jgi:hypothetical protein